MVRDLQEPASELQDPELQYAVASVFAQPFVEAATAESGAAGGTVSSMAVSNGLEVFVRMLQLPRAAAEPMHVYLLLRLLHAACNLEVRCQEGWAQYPAMYGLGFGSVLARQSSYHSLILMKI